MEIKEEYVSREVAKLLKEKGFNIPCHYTYHSLIGYTPLIDYHHKKHNYNGSEYSGKNTEWFSAPTHQVACAWLRDMYQIHISIDWRYKYDTNETDDFTIVYFWDISSPIKNVDVSSNLPFDEYGDCIEAALKYSLENLI